MLNWIEEFKPINKGKETIHHRRFNLKKVSFESTSSMTELARFVSAGSVLLVDNMMNTLSAKDDTARNLILNDIAPHFIDVKVVYVEDEVEVINMQYLKEESKKLFDSTSNGIILVMHDLYRNRNMSVWKSEQRRELIQFTVKIDELNVYDIPNTKDIKEFLKKGYFDLGEEFSLIPTGWTIEEELKESITLRFFATFIPCITLVVDSTNRQVVLLQLSGY
jgi:hypothetical protein